MHRSALTRVLVTVLLLLAVSPATAPFLTFDARVLFGDDMLPDAVITQSKKAHDEPASMAVGVPSVPQNPAGIVPWIGPDQGRVRVGLPAFVPLRI
jgi:hypothetical protein